MKRKFLSVLMTLCLVTTLFPALTVEVSADAAPVSLTNVIVGGTEVVSNAATYWKGDGAGGITSDGASESDYTVKYAPASGTSPAALTLSGAAITKSHVIQYSGDFGIFILGSSSESPATLLIELVGTNTVNERTGTESSSFGMYSTWCNLEITGPEGSSLTVSGRDNTSHSCGIEVQNYQNLIISGGTEVAAEGGDRCTLGRGVLASGELTLKDSAKLTATGGADGDRSEGVYGRGTITLSDSAKLTATGGDSTNSSTGIYSYDGSITLNDNASAEATGGTSTEGSSYGVNVGSFTINDDATIEATGGNAEGSYTFENNTVYGNSYGIYARSSSVGNINISGGAVTATCGTCHTSGLAYAMYASNAIAVDNSLHIQGEGSADGWRRAAISTSTSPDDANKTIRLGLDGTGETAKKVYISDDNTPVFEDGFGTTGLAFEDDGGTVGTDKGYTFEGWYNGDFKLTDLDDAAAGNGISYTARWTKNGNIVVTTPLTFNTSSTVKITYIGTDGKGKSSSIGSDITDSGEGWAWYVNGTTVDGIAYTGKVLVLNGVNIDTDTTALALRVSSDATVVICGENSIKSRDDIRSNGIDINSGIVTFAGNGRLTIHGIMAGVWADTASLTISSGSITITADKNNGIFLGLHGSFNISGGELNVTSNELIDKKRSAICTGSYTQSGGTVTATSMWRGIYTSTMDISGGTLTAYGTDAVEGYEGIGIDLRPNAGSIDISGGTVTAKGAVKAFGSEPIFDSTFEHSVTAGANADGSGASVVSNPSEATFTGSKYVRIAPGSAPPPAGGGGGGSSAITVPASSDGGSVNVKATVSSGKATIAVTDAQLEKIVSGNQKAGTVNIDLSSLNVDKAVIPAKLIKAAAEATGTEGLEVELKTGTVILDNKALDSIGNEDITISVEEIMASQLTAAQKEAIEDKLDTAIVVDVNVLINGVKTSNFKGGLITVGIPYEAKAGEDTSRLTVWYLKDDGTIEKMGGQYDAKAKMFIFKTTHLSKYVLVSADAAAVNPFKDVKSSAYYYDAVMWANGNGITQGTTATTFTPDATCTRAQMVTFLWRAMGSPEPIATANPFTDVKSSAYYYKAVMWAAETGITKGTTATTFTPNATVTREQMVTNLYRYAQSKGLGFTGEWMFLLDYNDRASVSDWAYEPFCWMTKNDIVEGSNGNLMPKADATRAQVTTILYRFCEEIK